MFSKLGAQNGYLLSSLVGGPPNADDGDFWVLSAVGVGRRALVAVDITETEADVRRVLVHAGLHHPGADGGHVQASVCDMDGHSHDQITSDKSDAQRRNPW